MPPKPCPYCQHPNPKYFDKHVTTCPKNPVVVSKLRAWADEQRTIIDGKEYFAPKNVYIRTRHAGLPDAKTLYKIFGNKWDNVRCHIAPHYQLHPSSENGRGTARIRPREAPRPGIPYIRATVPSIAKSTRGWVDAENLAALAGPGLPCMPARKVTWTDRAGRTYTETRYTLR